jgi:histone H3/H4
MGCYNLKEKRKTHLAVKKGTESSFKSDTNLFNVRSDILGENHLLRKASSHTSIIKQEAHNDRMAGLSLAAMERLLREGSDLRIGEDAKAALQEELERHALIIAQKAGVLAQHAGRRTVKAEDIKLAAKGQ